MRKVTDLVKKYPRRTILIVVAIFFIPLIIVHLLFKWNTSIEFLGAEWDAGDLLAYIAGFETLVGTLILGLITVKQAERADAVNERLSRENNSLQKIAIQKLIPVLKVVSVEVSDSNIVDHSYIRFDNLITVEEHFTVDSFINRIETYIKPIGNTEAYKKSVQLVLENISESVIRKISIDKIVFPGFKLCGHEISAITCAGETKYKSIGSLLMPGERLHIMVNIYYTANQIEQDLKQTQQYQELKAAYEALKADGKAYACFKELQDLQGQLQQKQMQGNITEEDFKELQEAGAKAKDFETLQTLMLKEQALSMLMDEVSKIIFQPVQELYQD